MAHSNSYNTNVLGDALLEGGTFQTLDGARSMFARFCDVVYYLSLFIHVDVFAVSLQTHRPNVGVICASFLFAILPKQTDLEHCVLYLDALYI